MTTRHRPPLIGITGYRRSARGVHNGHASLDALEIEGYFAGYADHVGAAGGIAVHLASTVDAAEVVARLDGLVLTGGGDVDPARYGNTSCTTALGVNPARDERELALFHAALGRGVPVLAICRGLQLANVALGGTLHGHLAQHPQGEWHDVRIEPGTALAGLHGATAWVNSLHHQAIDRLGAGLVVTARAPDGVIEGAERPGTPLLGVQWHPEQLDQPQPVFGWLVQAASSAAHRVTASH